MTENKSVQWNEMTYFEALPVNEEPEYAAGFTCDVCGVEYSIGPFYHNSKKGRDACLRCAVECGVHYLPGAICSVLLPTPEASSPSSKRTGPLLFCVLQFSTDSFAAILGDGTSVTVFRTASTTSKQHHLLPFSTCLVQSNIVKRDREGRIQRFGLVSATRAAKSMQFSEALKMFPCLAVCATAASLANPVNFRCVELGSPLQQPLTAVAAANAPCVLWHNFVDDRKLDTSLEDARQPLSITIISRVLHAWDSTSGTEVLIDFSSILSPLPLDDGGGDLRKVLDKSVRAVFSFGYAVVNWRSSSNENSLVSNILDRLAQIVPSGAA